MRKRLAPLGLYVALADRGAGLPHEDNTDEAGHERDRFR
jgi:hypothetical protein